jgi:hypothetical protein
MMINRHANRETLPISINIKGNPVRSGHKNMEEKYSTFIRSGKIFTRRLVIVNIKHNKSNTRIYSIWKGMRYRCSNPNRPKYKHYGGKGISVSDEWTGENGFINFYNWSMENGYNDNLTIDRIDSNKNYSPENCQWISLLENISKNFGKKRFPKYKYTAINEKMNLIVTFYFVEEFFKIYKIDSRRISECCNNKRSEYKNWKFYKEEINMTKRQETIPQGSTMEDEFPLEVRNIRKDDDIVHPV